MSRPGVSIDLLSESVPSAAMGKPFLQCPRLLSHLNILAGTQHHVRQASPTLQLLYSVPQPRSPTPTYHN